MLGSSHPTPEYAGPGFSSRALDPNGVALPFNDHLIVIASDGTVLALDSGGRRLWEALQAGCTFDHLVEAGVEHGGLPRELARANVARALDSWRALGLIDTPGQETTATPVVRRAPVRRAGRTPALDAVYLVGDLPVRVRCDDTVLGMVLDAGCGSHRIDDEDRAAADVDVIEQGDGLAVRAENALLARTDETTQNRALARHRCLTALLETSRQRKWLGILHASAVGAAGRCVVLPGAKGSGKSTLAAALVAAGADFVTDDYAPLEQGSCQIWPVPYAPGIKHGSWPALGLRYPDLEARPVYELAGMRVRYLDLDPARMAPLDRGLAVEALVFPRYQAGAALEQEPITPAAALIELCHAKSMLDRRPDVLAETLRWIESVPAYRLTYGDLGEAVDWVLSLLDAE